MDNKNQDFEQEGTENQSGQQNGMGNGAAVEQGNLSWDQIWGKFKAWVKERWLELTIGSIAFMIISPIVSGIISGITSDTYTYTHEDGTKCSFVIDFENKTYEYSGYDLVSTSWGYYVDDSRTWEKDGYIIYKETVNGKKRYWSADFDYYFVLSEDEKTLSMGGLTFKLE